MYTRNFDAFKNDASSNDSRRTPWGVVTDFPGPKLIQPREHVQSLLRNPNFILFVHKTILTLKEFFPSVQQLSQKSLLLWSFVMLKDRLSLSLGYRKVKAFYCRKRTYRYQQINVHNGDENAIKIWRQHFKRSLSFAVGSISAASV